MMTQKIRMKNGFSSLVFLSLVFLAPGTGQGGKPYGDPDQPYDKLPGTLETYHMKWATPLPQGKLKVLIIIPYFNSREVVELRQRLDLDYTVIMPCNNLSWVEKGDAEGGSSTQLMGGEEILKKLSLERLDLAKKYDAIVIAKMSWEVIPPAQKALILQHVERGTALIYVSPHRSGGFIKGTHFSPVLAKPEITTEDAVYATLTQTNMYAGVEQVILDSLPLDIIPLKIVADKEAFKKLKPAPQFPGANNMPAQQAVSIRGSRHGKGKVAVVDYYDGMTARQSFCSLTPKVVYDRLMYDYFYALLAKCVLWAVHGPPAISAAIDITAPTTTLTAPGPEKPLPAGWEQKTPKIVIARSDLSKAKLVLKAKGTGKDAMSVKMEAQIRDTRGDTVKTETAEAKVTGAGEVRRELTLPVLGRGSYTADMRILDKNGAVLDFASKSFRIEDPVQVRSVTTDKDWYEEGQIIRGKTEFSAPLREGESAEATAIDTWDRVVSKTPIAPGADRRSGTFEIKVERPLCRLWDVAVTISDKAGVVDTARTWVGLPNWTFDDYIWPLIFSTNPADFTWKGILFGAQVRKYGVNSGNAYLLHGAIKDYEMYERAHMMSVSFAAHFGQVHASTNLSQEFSDKCMAELGRTARNTIATEKPFDPGIKSKNVLRETLKFGTPYYWLTGEEYLSGEFQNKENSCFCPLCTSNFQAWCKGEYQGDLAALNAEWGSEFKDWGEVRGILLEAAVEKKQLPHWVAFRYFMRSRVWSQFFIDYTDMMQHLLGREVRTGTNGHDHYDFSRFRKHMTSGKLYVGSGTQNSVRVELQQSFSGDNSFFLNCGNYSFSSRLLGRRFPWRVMLAGSRGFDLESDGAGCTSLGGMSCMTPDYSEPMQYFKDISDQVLYLGRGIWKWCNTSKPVRSPVAILWSLPNHYISRLLPFQDNGFTGTWLYNVQVDGGAIQDALVLMKGLRIKPKFIAPEDLEGGVLKREGFKALILAYNKGMGAAEAEAVRTFVKEGGLVIADNEPGTYTKFGKKRDKSVLADIFPVLDKEHVEKVGKGVTAYVPGVINGYLGRMERNNYGGSDSVGYLLREHAGIKPVVELKDDKGCPRRDLITRVMDKGSLRLVGFMREATSEGVTGEDTEVELGKAYHVWDVRSGEYLSKVDKFKMKLDMMPKLYALMPAKPVGMEIKTAKGKVKAGDKAAVELEMKFEGGEDDEIGKMGQVAHIEVISPSGEELEWYRDNVLFEGRKAVMTLPISYSEKAGKYTVKAEYPFTGLKAETSFIIVQPGG